MSAGPSESADVPAPKVFISYRREETAAYAGRLYDAMVPQFGERNVFMDVDLEPGIDFVQRITAAVERLPRPDRGHGAQVGDDRGRGRGADRRAR